MEVKFKKYCEHVPLFYCIVIVLEPRVNLKFVQRLLKAIGEKLNVSNDLITISSVE